MGKKRLMQDQEFRFEEAHLHGVCTQKSYSLAANSYLACNTEFLHLSFSTLQCDTQPIW